MLSLLLIPLMGVDCNEEPTKMPPYFNNGAPVPPPNYPDPGINPPPDTTKDSSETQ